MERKRLGEADRVRWLLERAELWKELPSKVVEMGVKDWEQQRSIVEDMQAAGLYSRATSWRDVNLLRLIELARRFLKQRRQPGGR
jgi:hypothetical protein